ncbi:hypothetical protein V6N13_091799 [Hibiscus sabdariffa]|uniref:Uncharacterized protein n=1 Tax=Hibiscus sabdariffa TaxID=183260 RepID=A0ABR2QF34_9ROSI
MLCLVALSGFNYLKYRDSLTKTQRRDIERAGSEIGADERHDIEMGNLSTIPPAAESETRVVDIEASSIEGSEGTPPLRRTEAEYEIVLDEEGRQYRFYTPSRCPLRTQRRVSNPPRTETKFEVVSDEEGRPYRFYSPPRFSPPNFIPFQLA